MKTIAQLAEAAGFDVAADGTILAGGWCMSSGLTAELDVKAELESFAVLYRAEVIASLCAEDEPVAFANKFSPDGFPTDSEPLYSAETVAALQARVAELAKDAERYRFLRDNHGGDNPQSWCVFRPVI